MEHDMIEKVGLYRRRPIARRELMKLIVALTGGCAAAHFCMDLRGFAATLDSGQEAQSANVDAETVHYPRGDFDIQAYLAKPKGGGKHPGILLVHENRGLTSHICDVARRFAAEGFVAMAPDLLSRVGGTAKMHTPEAATSAINQLPLRAGVEDLKAGYSFLEKQPEVDTTKISAVGFGWGGWRTFELAMEVPTLYRVVVFYGSTPTDGLQNIQAPVMANYAQFDFRATGNAIPTQNFMKEMGKKFTFYVYPKVGYDFFDETSSRYDAEAAKLAWTRTLEFLRSSG